MGENNPSDVRRDRCDTLGFISHYAAKWSFKTLNLFFLSYSLFSIFSEKSELFYWKLKTKPPTIQRYRITLLIKLNNILWFEYSSVKITIRP